MAKKKARYWDSNVWLGILNAEDDKVSACTDVLERAREGEFLIVSSAITLAEVIRLRKTSVKLPRESDQKIRDFFKQEFVSLRNVDRSIAEMARDLVWKYRDVVAKKEDELKPWDAIHLATAIFWDVPLINTYDNDMLQIDGKEKCSAGDFLEIRRPEDRGENPLFGFMSVKN